MAEQPNGINFMALMNPQFAAQQASIQQQQAMAQQLMQDGSQQQPANELANPGGFVVPQSPWVAAGKALEKGVGGYMSGKALAAQMQAYQGLREQMTQPQNQGQALADGIAGNGNPSPQDAMNDPQFMHDALVAGVDNAYKGYLQRTSRTDQQKNFADPALHDLVKNEMVNKGLIEGGKDYINLPTKNQELPQPESSSVIPPAPQIVDGKPQAPANMDDLLNQQTNVMPNPIKGVTPGYDKNSSAAVAGAKTLAEEEAKNTAIADKGVVGIDSRINNVFKTLNEMADLSPQKGHGTFGEYVGVPLSRNVGKGVEAAAQTKFEQKNANLFTQELGPLLQSIQGTRGSIPLINAIKEASQIPEYGSKKEETGAIEGLKEQLKIYQENMHNAQAMQGSATPIPVTPNGLAAPQDIVDELRKRGHQIK